MATIVTRSGKGSALTHNEMDNNFTNLNTDKVEEGDNNTWTGTNVFNGTVNLTSTFQIAGVSVTATAAELNYVDGVTSAIQTQLNNRYSVGGTDVPVTDGGTGASTAADARTNLGLGSIATQASSSVSITGGSIAGITDLAVADGGTGASTAEAARTNLGFSGAAGTVATANLENSAVTRAKLSTTTSSQSGALPSSSIVTVSLSAYSFFPDIEAIDGSGDGIPIRTVDGPMSASADAPQFELHESNGSTGDYSVAWRYVVA